MTGIRPNSLRGESPRRGLRGSPDRISPIGKRLWRHCCRRPHGTGHRFSVGNKASLQLSLARVRDDPAIYPYSDVRKRLNGAVAGCARANSSDQSYVAAI